MKKTAVIKGPNDVCRYMWNLRKAYREHFYVLHLSTRRRVLHKELLTIGTLSKALVSPRDVFERAIVKHSHAIICVHNHPSGDPTPSREDIAVTRALIKAGIILGIPLLDHIIIAREGCRRILISAVCAIITQTLQGGL